ncbi:MAG: phosphoribosylformimino-5-aminoimidazole carboxamide ribotide isomerase [Lachnospiraceae bacterium]|jgi:phosphoribosylformimino-5-aminoimidazole carboxamide ribotide isomerase|nr:phosphoribosylformimino-5-aminoimidazole carboxamide ribotide isomerase [Lachnospiraceae bacterium]
MRFRPCIDIHNGAVKQIVGGSLHDQDTQSSETNIIENFVAVQDAAFFASLYCRLGLKGGHVILLNNPTSEAYISTREQALSALAAYPSGLQIGGGITADNAMAYLDAGASHVIVTSYVFSDGRIIWDNLDKLVMTTGKERLVLDLSCRKKDGQYFIVTDRWQKYTEVVLSTELLTELSAYCDEFLIHAVDVEGLSGGIDEELVRLMGQWNGIPITYAGGVHSFADLERLKILGQNRIDVTIGSALDLFGGTMKFEEVLNYLARK